MKLARTPPEFSRHEKDADAGGCQGRNPAPAGRGERAGEKARLVAGGSRAVRTAVLAQLAASGRIANLGSATSPAYFAGKPDLVATAAQLILAAAPTEPELLSMAKLKKLVKFKALQDHVIAAAGRLVAQKQALLLKSGRSVCLLHLAPVRDLLNAAPAEPARVAIDPPGLGTERVTKTLDDDKSLSAKVQEAVLPAYDQLVRLMGTPNVPIASLVQTSGLPLAQVLDFLRGECFAYRAVPTRGEPSLATPEERNAALVIGGESYF